MRSEAIFFILGLLLLAGGLLSSRSVVTRPVKAPLVATPPVVAPPVEAPLAEDPPVVRPRKSVGRYPKQSFDSSRDQTPWEVPEELRYPNWTQFFPDNNRIYTVDDSVETVAAWYTEKLPGSVREDKNGKRHVLIRNKDYEIDIESGGDKTKIAITPLAIMPRH